MPVKNVCECSNPPGGQIACEPYQMAICGVINGVIRRECLDPPTEGSPAVLANWVLSQISGENRFTGSEITVADLSTLNSGTFTSPNGEVVNFTIPEDMANMFRIMISGVQGGGSASGSAAAV